jgi:hypothetical protein
MDNGAGSRKIPSNVRHYFLLTTVVSPACFGYNCGNFNSIYPAKRTKGTSDPAFFNFRIGSTELEVFNRVVPDFLALFCVGVALGYRTLSFQRVRV